MFSIEEKKGRKQIRLPKAEKQESLSLQDYLYLIHASFSISFWFAIWLFIFSLSQAVYIEKLKASNNLQRLPSRVFTIIEISKFQWIHSLDS